jgi:hypothetical protein
MGQLNTKPEKTGSIGKLRGAVRLPSGLPGLEALLGPMSLKTHHAGLAPDRQGAIKGDALLCCHGDVATELRLGAIRASISALLAFEIKQGALASGVDQEGAIKSASNVEASAA